MMRQFSLAILLMTIAAGSLGAQRRQRVFTTNDPSVWFSAGVDGFRANVVNDGVTSSMWNFGNSTNLQYRASIEKGLTSGSSVGLAGSWGHVPFEYSSTAIIPPADGGTQCGRCDAHLDLMTLVGTFHSGAGPGFHQIVELNGGIVAYRNLKQDSDGAKLSPSGGNIDPLFSFGYGFGYGLSDRTNIDFTSNYTIGLHERKDLPNGASNTNSMPSLRLSLRMGFGKRKIMR
jgi:hypothetical protein